jgi:streptogramin lyase
MGLIERLARLTDRLSAPVGLGSTTRRSPRPGFLVEPLEERTLLSLTFENHPLPLIIPSMPQGIARGPDGGYWFTGPQIGDIGHVTPAGAVTEFAVPQASTTSLGGTTLGDDGNLWFAQGSSIGRITPAGVVTDYPLASSSSRVSGIRTGADGNVWFVDGGSIGRITPAGTITEFPVRQSTGAITAGPDGNLWFTLADDISDDGPNPLRSPWGGSLHPGR